MIANILPMPPLAFCVVQKCKVRTTPIILPSNLYWCESWYSTYSYIHKMRLSENEALRKIFESKRKEVGREWRKVHYEEIYNFFFSPDSTGGFNK